LELSRPVRLLQSALVEVPTVIGWLRPVILLPASCVTGLTPRQLESIIAHELAHIRRHDYLVNILQSAVETLLFYHPAVWWVSRRVREERELCCDDLVVEVCGDRVGYARALATLEELRPASAQFALAAAGAPLLQRIRRLAGQPERSAGRAFWPVAGITLLLVLGILAAGMREHRAAAQGVHDVSPIATTIVRSNSLVSPISSGDRVLTLAQNTANPADAATLETRTFHVDPGTFLQAVKSAVARSEFVEVGARTTTQTVDDIHTYFSLNGVDLGTNTGWAIIFNDRRGLLTVRAASQELRLIENVLMYLPAPAQEVNIKAKFVEITTQPGGTNAMFILGAQGTVGPVTGVLTDPQFRATINALEQHDGTDVLTSPEVTTESGRQAQMQVGDVQKIVLPGKGTNTSTTNMFIGQTLEAIATVSADKKMISMTLTPSITKFLGYVKVRTNSTVLTLPRFQLCQTTANVTVLDSSTVVIGGLTTDSTNADSQAAKKELLIFVTATIINPNGTRYHSEEEMKALLAGPPPAQSSTSSVGFTWNIIPGAKPLPTQGSTN
jgi:BlaR1 peptidase M56/Bacterial type II and III secretion system protein